MCEMWCLYHNLKDSSTFCHLSAPLICARSINKIISIIITRRMPVQRAVERDEIPYPYKVYDTTLRPLLNITIQKHNYIANYMSRIY